MKQNTHKCLHFDNSDVSPWPFTWVHVLLPTPSCVVVCLCYQQVPNYRSLGPLLACVWMDKRVIHFLTMLHVATQDVTVKQWTKDGC